MPTISDKNIAKVLLSSLFCRRQPQLITCYNDNPYTWIYYRGDIEEPGSKDKVKNDETYHRVEFDEEFMGPFLDQFPLLQQPWIIDRLSFYSTYNKAKEDPFKLNVNEGNLFAWNEETKNWDHVGIPVSFQHMKMIEFFFFYADSGLTTHSIDIDFNAFTRSGIVFQEVDIAKYYGDQFGPKTIQYPLQDGTNIVSNNEYIKKFVKEFSCKLHFTITKQSGLFNNFIIYKDNNMRIVSTRPLINIFFRKEKRDER